METERLILRQLTFNDTENLLQIFSDAEAMRYYPGTKSRRETEEWIDWNMTSYRENEFGLWAAILKGSGEFVGQCGLVAQEVDERREVEIGYLFVRKFWGRGLATEAARASRDYGINQLGCRRLISLIDPGNIASQRVAEKVGMKLEKEIEKWGKAVSLYSLDVAKITRLACFWFALFVLNLGRVAVILPMLFMGLVSLPAGPLVTSARAQQPTMPTVFIIGDSTVKTPTEGQQGWGDPIADLFDQAKIRVENRARGGRSSRTFQTEGLWDQVLAELKPGDFVLMQFGHNDGGAVNDTSRARGSIRGIGEETEEIDNLITKKHEVVHTFGWYMRKYVSDTKAKGATPIVLSLIPRNIWKDGKVVRAVDTYGGWAAQVAKSQSALFIDLNELVARHYEMVGAEKVGKEYFLNDHTHTTPVGARVNAELVVSDLRELKDCPLASFLMKQGSSAAAEAITLWPDGAPGAIGKDPADIPTLTPYLPKGKATGAAVIVCPGGGYNHLADHEGRPVAEWLSSIGISAFVLKYRHGPRYHHPAPLQDAARAIRLVRARAVEWQIDHKRIGILGFSAGGHLASTIGTHFDAGQPTSSDVVERVSSRPDVMILIYPVITMGKFTHSGSKKELLGESPAVDVVKLLSNEEQVTKQTPPTFLVHTANDTAVPVENSLQFADALRRTGVPFELHIYESGPHGFGLGRNNSVLATWPARCEDWLRLQGF